MAPAKVWAKGVSSSEMNVTWEPVQQDVNGILLGYEVSTSWGLVIPPGITQANCASSLQHYGHRCLEDSLADTPREDRCADSLQGNAWQRQCWELGGLGEVGLGRATACSFHARAHPAWHLQAVQKTARSCVPLISLLLGNSRPSRSGLSPVPAPDCRAATDWVRKGGKLGASLPE